MSKTELRALALEKKENELLNIYRGAIRQKAYDRIASEDFDPEREKWVLESIPHPELFSEILHK